jgi:hypothetical protein
MHIRRRRTGVRFSPSLLERKAAVKGGFFVGFSAVGRMHIRRRRTGVRFSPSLLERKAAVKGGFFVGFSAVGKMHIRRRRTGVRFSPSLLERKAAVKGGFFVGLRAEFLFWLGEGVRVCIALQAEGCRSLKIIDLCVRGTQIHA